MTCAEKYDTPQSLDMAHKKVYEEKTAKVVQVEKKKFQKRPRCCMT